MKVTLVIPTVNEIDGMKAIMPRIKENPNSIISPKKEIKMSAESFLI